MSGHENNPGNQTAGGPGHGPVIMFMASACGALGGGLIGAVLGALLSCACR